MSANPDIIDELVGIAPGSRLDQVRARRPAARENAQKSYTALFDPAVPGSFTLDERLALAAFVTGLHRNPLIAGFYATRLAAEAGGGVADAIVAEVGHGTANGPYGEYPAGPLSRENRDGVHYQVSDDSRAKLGIRLSAGLEHAHLLVFRPRDASPAALKALLDAGWTVDEVVTLSQIAAFLSFQIRVVTGLTALAAAQPSTGYASFVASPLAAE